MGSFYIELTALVCTQKKLSKIFWANMSEFSQPLISWKLSSFAKIKFGKIISKNTLFINLQCYTNCTQGQY